MNETVREDLIAIYSETLEALKERGEARISEISNHTIHNASIFQDEDSISAAVIVYALSKMRKRGMEVESRVLSSIGKAIDGLKRRRLGTYNREIKAITSMIRDADDKMNRYIQQVLDEAEIKKGSKLYDQGISLARASQLLGVSQWDMMAYVGKTKIIDRNQDVDERISSRIELTRKIFGISEGSG